MRSHSGTRELPDSDSDSTRAAATGVPNIAPSMPVRRQPDPHLHPNDREQPTANRENQTDRHTHDRVPGAEAHTTRQHQDQGDQQTGQDRQRERRLHQPKRRRIPAGVAGYRPLHHQSDRHTRQPSG